MLLRSTSIFLTALTVWAAPGAAQVTERIYQQACDEGDLTACNVFGLMYETGEGVPRDFARAAELYRRACEGGEPLGCTNLGLLYAAGAGVPQDTTRAGGFFRVACEGGEQLGCTWLRTLQDAIATEPTQRYDKAGRVGDAETERPLPEAVVEVLELGVRAVSDADGRFLLTGMPAGTYAIRAERLGYEQLLGTVQVPGDPTFVMLMTPDDEVDGGAAGQVVGRVLEGDEEGLSNVEVSVLGQVRARTLSNQQGRFTIRDVEPGLVVVRFARLGYAPRTATLVVQPGRTAEVSTTMAVQPIELEPIQVSIRSRYLERDGFYERAGRGWGTHFTPGELERIQPIEVSDLFRGRVPGVRVVRVWDPTMHTYVNRLLSRRGGSFNMGPCYLSVYVDGVRMFDADIDLLPAQSLAAAEVYVGAGTPVEYSFGGCGAALIWTRRGN